MRAVCMISNNSSFADIISRINHKFDIMYNKRAFVHWFIGEGLDEGSMIDARNDLSSLEKDYEEIGVEYGRNDGGR